MGSYGVRRRTSPKYSAATMKAAQTCTATRASLGCRRGANTTSAASTAGSAKPMAWIEPQRDAVGAQLPLPRDHVQCRRDYDALVRAVQALL